MKKFYLFILTIFLCSVFGCSENNINNENQPWISIIESWTFENANQPEQKDETFDEIDNSISDWIISIPQDWIIYRNDEYGFQVKFWKERSGGRIYDSFRKYNLDNYNDDYDGWIKNPYIVFTVPSPWMSWTFESIAGIIVYTYDEYKQARQYQMDPECMMCSLEEFDKAIIWKNNKYYFLLWRWNNSHDAYKTMFPWLECREETWWEWNQYTYIYCDWIEYINWEPKKTWKDWIEQLFPSESFEFFDVE